MNYKSTINRIVWVVTLFAVTFVAYSRANATNGYYLISDHPTIQQPGSNYPNYYYFGSDPNTVNASVMAAAIADKLGKPITVVSALAGETTSANSDLLIPSSSGQVKDVTTSTILVSDIINGQLRPSGTQIVGGVTFNNFVLRVFTGAQVPVGTYKTQFYDLTVKISSFDGQTGVWSFGQISSALPIFGPLANVSSRAQVLTQDNVIIAGFIIAGTGSKQVLIRGIGPSLTAFGISNALPDPTITLKNSQGQVIATNNDWKDTQAWQILATKFQPSNDLESAIFTELAPGNYTVILSGNNNTTGTGTLEIYDIQGSALIKNFSARASVGTGDNLLIEGVIIKSPTGGPQLLIFAKGPSLTAAGVAGAMQDPILELHDASGALIVSNDNWKDTQQADIQATGLTPSNDSESGILTNLAPGNYTAVVKGANNTTGVALVEIYKLEGVVDTDGDGLDDRWETQNFGNLNQTATGDYDGDKVSNFNEFRNGLNPNSSVDSDGDGLPDDWEKFWFGSLSKLGTDDSDGDGLTNADEFRFGTSPKYNDGAIPGPGGGLSSASITYDSLARLITIGSTSYSYDAEGNILSGN